MDGGKMINFKAKMEKGKNSTMMHLQTSND